MSGENTNNALFRGIIASYLSKYLNGDTIRVNDLNVKCYIKYLCIMQNRCIEPMVSLRMKATLKTLKFVTHPNLIFQSNHINDELFNNNSVQ